MRTPDALIRFTSVCLNMAVGLLIALAAMKGSGPWAVIFFLLAVLVGLIQVARYLDRLTHEAPIPIPERHVPTGEFKGATQIHPALYLADRSHTVFQDRKSS